MHDDDETRFPRITLSQFLGGVLWGVLYAGSWLAGYGASTAPTSREGDEESIGL
jgi:hypothetical protein